MTQYITEMDGVPFGDKGAKDDIAQLNSQFKDIAKQIGDETLQTTAQDLKGSINEVFQNVSNGKQLIATAITDKGVNTSSDDTFQTMAINISKISGGSIEGKIVTINNKKYKLSTDSTGNIIATIVKYTVINTLPHATNSNSNTEIEYGSSYNATINAIIGYKLKTITITMGGTNITNSVYSNGVVNIPSVTGNIVITVTTDIDSDSVTGSMDNNNAITLTGLNTGRYTLKYEDDNGILPDYSVIATMEVE